MPNCAGACRQKHCPRGLPMQSHSHTPSIHPPPTHPLPSTHLPQRPLLLQLLAKLLLLALPVLVRQKVGPHGGVLAQVGKPPQAAPRAAAAPRAGRLHTAHTSSRSSGMQHERLVEKGTIAGLALPGRANAACHKQGLERKNQAHPRRAPWPRPPPRSGSWAPLLAARPPRPPPPPPPPRPGQTTASAWPQSWPAWPPAPGPSPVARAPGPLAQRAGPLPAGPHLPAPPPRFISQRRAAGFVPTPPCSAHPAGRAWPLRPSLPAWQAPGQRPKPCTPHLSCPHLHSTPPLPCPGP